MTRPRAADEHAALADTRFAATAAVARGRAPTPGQSANRHRRRHRTCRPGNASAGLAARSPTRRRSSLRRAGTRMIWRAGCSIASAMNGELSSWPWKRCLATRSAARPVSGCGRSGSPKISSSTRALAVNPQFEFKHRPPHRLPSPLAHARGYRTTVFDKGHYHIYIYWTESGLADESWAGVRFAWTTS